MRERSASGISEIDSLNGWLDGLGPETIPDVVALLSDEETLILLYDWHLWVCEKQRLPRVKDVGKTRTGAEVVRDATRRGLKNAQLAPRCSAQTGVFTGVNLRFHLAPATPHPRRRFCEGQSRLMHFDSRFR